jgi:hypothetical protein
LEQVEGWHRYLAFGLGQLWLAAALVVDWSVPLLQAVAQSVLSMKGIALTEWSIEEWESSLIHPHHQLNRERSPLMMAERNVPLD